MPRPSDRGFVLESRLPDWGERALLSATTSYGNASAGVRASLLHMVRDGRWNTQLICRRWYSTRLAKERMPNSQVTYPQVPKCQNACLRMTSFSEFYCTTVRDPAARSAAEKKSTFCMRNAVHWAARSAARTKSEMTLRRGGSGPNLEMRFLRPVQKLFLK